MKVTHNTPSNAALGQKSVEATKQAQDTAAKAEKSRAGEVRQTGKSADIEISDNARLMRKATEVVQNSPDIRADKVAALKKAIQDGSYKVDSEKVAEKVLEEHLGADFGKNRL